jgi:hypothetical protein
MLKRILPSLFAVVCLSTISAGAQQTLGSINGSVVDASGAAIPAATVTVTDKEINVNRTVKAQGDGFFQIFNLPIGTYTVTVTHDGFETGAYNGVQVQEAHATTLSAKLLVGKVAESVEVTANPLLNATDATNGYTLDNSQVATIPLATGSFTQAAVLSPGANAELLSNLDTNSGLGNQPIWANGQRDTSNTFQVNGVDASNIFNGKSSSGSNSQRYAFNIGQSTGIAGAAGVGTSVYGSNGNALPSPVPETIQELRVNTSLYDAQQGATSGAQIDVNTISGTNTYHGMLYGTFANNSLNAAPFFFKQQYLLGTEGVGAFPEALANPALHRWTTGATVGGPIIKDKLFFFFAYQYRYNSDQSTGLSQLTVPSALTNDRSATGLNNALTSWNNGTPVTGYTISPIASAIFNATLPNGQYLIPSAQTNAPYQYSVPNVTLMGTSQLTANQAVADVDYNVNSTDRLSFKYYFQSDPVEKPYAFGQTGGFPVTQLNGSQVFAIDNTKSFGSRFNWEQRLGFDRMGSYSYYNQTLPCSSTLGCNYGIGSGSTGVLTNTLPGLYFEKFAINNSVSPGVSAGPYSAFVNTGFYQNRINPSSNLIVSLGKHTLIVGGGYSFTQLNIENNRQMHPQIELKNFETFLEDSSKDIAKATVLESTANGHNDSDRYYRSNEIASYAQDKWQALPNLSITAGVRYDYHGGLTEKYGNIFNFNPALYNVTGTVATGFTVNNAGFVVAGNNAYNPTAGTSDSTLTGRQWGFSPRLGFAWSPKRFENKIVINGGAGIYYDRGELFTYLSQPAGSGNGGPFGVTESSPLANFVTGNGTSLNNPIGTATSTSSGYIAPSANPTTITAALQTVLGKGPVNAAAGTGSTYGYSGTNHAKYGQNCSAQDNQEEYTDCPDALNFAAYDKNNVLPYTINYALNLQWQPRSDLAVTIGYDGNRGRHSVIPIPLNEPGIATANNPIHGETSSYGFEVLNQNNFTGYDYAAIPGEPWNSEDGGNTDFRVPYIGFSPNAADFKTAGTSAYDALQTHVEKRLSHNIAGGVSYTYSHALDEQSDIGIFFTGNNPANLRSSYASSDFDRTHVFTANFDAILPDLARPHSLLAYATNGWSLTGIGVVQSGEPYSLYEYYGAVGSIDFGDYPTLLNPVLPISNPKQAKTTGLTGNPGNFRSGSAYVPTINPSDIAINYLAPGTDGIPAQSGNNPADEYETDFAPTNQRNIFRQAMQKRLDLSFRKTFKFGNKLGLLYNFDVYNVFNETSLDVPQNQTQIRQNYACSASAEAVKGNNCQEDYVNYGQIVSSSSPADQASTLANLDQKPVYNGTGRGITIPTTLAVGQGACAAGTINSTSCPNNGANFGSVTNTIGGNRAIVMGLHLTY